MYSTGAISIGKLKGILEIREHIIHVTSGESCRKVSP